MRRHPRIAPALPNPDSPAERLRRGEGTGRLPKFEPTEDQRYQVMVFAANGTNRQTIADCMRINLATLDKYFKDDIKKGRDYITARVGASMVHRAINGDVGAGRYWLTTHGGPEWQVSKRDSDAELAAALSSTTRDEEGERKVKFYIPRNGRDRPETPEPPIIDGAAEEPDARTA